MAAEDWLRVSSGKLQGGAESLPLDARSFQVRCFRAARWYGSGRILNRSSQDRAFDGKALDPYLSAFVDRQQRIHCRGIEPLARETPDDLQGLVRRVCLLVRAIGSKRVKGIRHCDYPGYQWNLIALQTVRIPAAIECFMVQFDSGQHLRQLRHRTQDIRTLRRVCLHYFEFFFGE